MTNKTASIFISSQLKPSFTNSVFVWSLCLLFAVGPVIKAQESAAEMRALEDGKPVERELKGGEAHSYRIALARDQYLEVMIEQRGVDVAIALVGPDGKMLGEVNRAKGAKGAETLTFVADAPGSYRLEVRAAEKNATTGRYEVQIIKLRTATPEERTLEEARRLAEESRGLRQKGKYDDALPPAERALAIREKALGPDHLRVAESLFALASIYDDKEEYAKAEPLFSRSLAIYEKTLGPEHTDVARALRSLAWIYSVRQDYAKAESFYRRALSIQEKALGPEHSEVAVTLNDLALLYYEKGDYDQSIEINRRVLEIREKTAGPESEGAARALNNLALSHSWRGDYAQAESLLRRALIIDEKLYGLEHPEVATTLDNLANARQDQGDYAEAEMLYQRSLVIREKTFGPDHPKVAQSLHNIGTLYERKGDYQKAGELFRRSAEISEKKLGPDDPDVATSLYHLAKVYMEQGNYAQAEQPLRRALVILEKALGPEHSEVAFALELIGRLYFQSKKDYTQAEAFLQRAVAILEKVLGPEKPQVAVALSGLAALYLSQGDYARAETLYRRALSIREKALGPDHPDVAQALDDLGRLSQVKGDAEQALAFLSRAGEVRERNFNHNLPLGSERQKLSYLKLFADDTDHALSLHAQLAPRDPRALQLAFTTLLRRKGRALDMMSDQMAALRRRADPQDQALFGRLSASRSRLATWTLRGPDKKNAAVYPVQLKRLEDEVEELEAEISARSAQFRAQSSPITLEAIQALIPDKTALVEYALYHQSGVKSASASTTRTRYAAYVLTRQGEARWVELGEAATIDSAIEAWRQALRDPDRKDVRRLARALDAKLVEPVRALLGHSEHLLISADGPLNLIPFAALVDEQGEYLVERYTITYLTSGRDLLRLQVARESKSPPVVMADPAFGEPATIASRPRGPQANGASHGEAAGQGAAEVDYSQIFFGPLPGVSGEVRALRELLPQATFLTKEQAVEAALKRVSGPSILHIATHGFFLEDQESANDQSRAATARSKEATRLGRWVAHVENPLLRSGLALAGINQGRSGVDDDGALTALEAAGLDLWGTKLVVLSACDTGVGVVRSGDGVYGLRRSLVLAGAESQMMSLWPVSDRSTRELVVAYYKELMRGRGRGESLRQVQLQMLRGRALSHPYYWASFIQSGEWAKLEGRR
ncbi:MAG TPA: tetratricopeptide repeat protein [Pyrinomonadaceae bacterium]